MLDILVIPANLSAERSRDMDVRSEWAEQLLKLRRQLNFSQREMADWLTTKTRAERHVDSTTISKWENGLRPAPLWLRYVIEQNLDPE